MYKNIAFWSGNCAVGHAQGRPSLMSALGQKQTLAQVSVMSALPPKADIGTQSWDVRYVPKADILHCSKERRHSITSSARASSCGGTVVPNSFAVLRLMTSSSFVG